MKVPITPHHLEYRYSAPPPKIIALGSFSRVSRLRVEGLSKSPQSNGRLGTIQREVEGGGLRVVLNQDGKMLTLKSENLVEVHQGQKGRVTSSFAGMDTAMRQRTYGRGGGSDEQHMLVYNFCAP